MNREEILHKIKNTSSFDFIIIGGGATGLGVAVDAASRGFSALLIEQNDFSSGTSSRSTKLIHGGLRYLQKGDIHLVTEALKERGLLCHNAPHLVHHRAFLVPSYHFWEGPLYGIGLKIYDILAGKLGLEPSKHINKDKLLEAIPTLEKKDLRGGTIYYDGQFDDSRLAITLLKTFQEHGGLAVNYCKATELIKDNQKIQGVAFKDVESNVEYRALGKVVINATGAFSDTIRHMDKPDATNLIAPSQGVHIVLDKCFLPSDLAILVPHTRDKRVLFMVPWHDHILVGTTDTQVQDVSQEPIALDQEIDFLLETSSKYLSMHPERKDILSVFAGIRPLVKASSGKNTASLSRDHHIEVSSSKLITIAGGKWTTYRKMAQDVVETAIKEHSLKDSSCKTINLKLHGYVETCDIEDHLSVYGTDREKLEKLISEDSTLKELLDAKLPYLKAEALYAIRYEMARTPSDILARRTRALFLNAQAAINAAPYVCSLLRTELNKDSAWEQEMLNDFIKLAKGYLPK